jgi:hypothetical protein
MNPPVIHFVRLPDGKFVTIREYIKIIRKLKLKKIIFKKNKN